MKIQTGLYALMAGVTIGLAVWGAQGIEGWCPTSRYMPMLLTTPKTISESDAKIDVDANNTKIDASVDATGCAMAASTSSTPSSGSTSPAVRWTAYRNAASTKNKKPAGAPTPTSCKG